METHIGQMARCCQRQSANGRLANFALPLAMPKKPFATQVIEDMHAAGMTAMDLHRQSGVSYDIINKLKRRPESSTNAEDGARLARVLGLDWPTEAPSAPGSNHDGETLVSVYNVAAAAGVPRIVGEEYEVDQLAFPPGYLRRITKSDPKNLAIIGVKGDSMLPTLRDDDVVMVDLTKRDLSWGGIFVLRVDGDGLLVKRVSMGSQRGFFKIVSDNAAAFPPVERRAEDLEIIGRVIWYGVKV